MRPRSIGWVLATTLGLFLGGFVLHFPGSYGESEFSVGAALFGLILGSVNGVVAGLLMGLAIGASRRRVGDLVLAMGAAVGVTHAIFDGSSTAFPEAAYAIVSGILVAAVFARTLGLRSQRAIAVVGLGWTFGLIAANVVGGWLGLPWEETPLGWATDHAADGIVVGVVWAITTAAIGLPSTIVDGIKPEPAGRLRPA